MIGLQFCKNLQYCSLAAPETLLGDWLASNNLAALYPETLRRNDLYILCEKGNDSNCSTTTWVLGVATATCHCCMVEAQVSAHPACSS